MKVLLRYILSETLYMKILLVLPLAQTFLFISINTWLSDDV